MYHIDAKKYLEHEIITFPLNGKAPANDKNWREFTEEDVEELSEKYIGSGVGVACGKKSNLVFIDIDTEDPTLQAIITKYIDENFPTSMMRYGSRKRLPSLLYVYDGQTSIKIMNGKEAIVEILSTGRYCAIAGPHPEQEEEYEFNCDIFEKLPYVDEWPSFTDHNIENLKVIIDKYFEATQSDITDKSQYSLKTRAEGKVVCVHGSHNFLTDCIFSLFDRCDGEELTDKVLELDDEINTDTGHCSYYEDRKRGAKHGKTRRGSCEDHIESARKTVNERRKKRGLPDIIPFRPLKKDIIKVEDIGKKIIVAKDIQDIRKPLPVAPNGALQDMFQSIYDSSPIKRSRLSICSALNVISTAIGTNARFWGSYANIYSIIVADSGSGKNAPLKAVHQVLHQLQFKHLIGESNIVSTKGVIAGLQMQPERVDVIDEFGRLLKKSKERGSIVSDAFDMYNQLYSDVSGHFGGAKIDINGTRMTYGECNHPYINFIGATTPSAFSESFDEELFLQGWGSRSMIFCDTEFKKSPFNMSGYYLKVPDSVKQVFHNIRGTAQADHLKTAPFTNGEGRNKTVEFIDNRKTIDIDADGAAKNLLRECHSAIEYIKEKSYNNNDTLNKILTSRQYNLVKKVSMISAVSSGCIHDNLKNVIIRDYDVDYAFRLITHLNSEAKQFMGLNMYKSRHDEMIKKIKKTILETRADGLSIAGAMKANSQFKMSDVISGLEWLTKADNTIHIDEGTYYSKKFISIEGGDDEL